MMHNSIYYQSILCYTCLEQFRSRMAFRLPFQCSSWKTVISSWNSSIDLPRFDSSMKRKAPIPVLGFSVSSCTPCDGTEANSEYSYNTATHIGFVSSSTPCDDTEVNSEYSYTTVTATQTLTHSENLRRHIRH